MTDFTDIIVVGAGPNGLACALVLARTGLTVRVLESKPAVVGGLRGEHRLGLLPSDLLRLLNLKNLPIVAREPRAFVPSLGLVGSLAGDDELDALLDDLKPAWLGAPVGLAETAERYLRPALRKPFLDLVAGSAAAHLDRVGHPHAAAVCADALRASFAGPDTEGSGAALFARHAAARTDGGADAVPAETFEALVRVLGEAARAAGAKIEPATVDRILVEGNSACGVLLADGRELRTTSVACSADPFRLRAMVGEDRFPADWNKKVDALARPTSVCRIVLALSALPALPPHAHRAVTQLLPSNGMDGLRAHHADAVAGRLPSAPAMEMTFDGSTASLWIPWAPYDLPGTTWAAEEEAFLARIVAHADSFVPGLKALVVDATVFHPKKLETLFGVTHGHPHHVDDAVLFGDRLGYATPIQGLYACGAGCAPVGGAWGLPGYNAAKRILDDIDVALDRTDVGIRRPTLPR